MKYSNKIQRIAIERAAKKLNLDAHISTAERKSDLFTYAEKLMWMWFRKGIPYKKSYMMCDALDMCFLFTSEGEAVYTYSGYADKRDACEERIVNAFRMANQMRNYMMEEAEKLSKEETYAEGN